MDVTESNIPESFVFIRHGVAIEREVFDGDDAERPLTSKGKKKTEDAMDGLLSVAVPQQILTSDYVRARQTAEILRDRIVAAGKPAPTIKVTPALRPDKTCYDLRAYINQQDFTDIKTVACVGHEPSLSNMLSKFLGAKVKAVPLKKSGAAVVKVKTWDKGELSAFLPPKTLRMLVEK